jgi:cell division protein FtsB
MKHDGSGTEFRRFRRPRMPGGVSARRVFWIGAAVVLAYLFIFSEFGLYRRWQLAREEAVIRDGIESLESRKTDLEAERGMLEDDAYLERIAREEHGMVKKDEHVYRLASPDTSGDGGR